MNSFTTAEQHPVEGYYTVTQLIELYSYSDTAIFSMQSRGLLTGVKFPGGGRRNYYKATEIHKLLGKPRPHKRKHLTFGATTT